MFVENRLFFIPSPYNSAPDTDSASLLLLIIFVVATLCVNKDYIYIYNYCLS